MVITEKDLMNIAGWECIKEAKQLLDLDSVKAVNMNKGDSFPLIITGKVIEKRKNFVCGLKFINLNEVENLCRCPESLRDGKICKHSIALILQQIKRVQDKGYEQEFLNESNDVNKSGKGNSYLPLVELPSEGFKNVSKFNIKFVKYNNLSFLNEVDLQEVLFDKSVSGCGKISDGQTYTIGIKQLVSLFKKSESGYIELEHLGTIKKLIVSELSPRIPILVSYINQKELEIKREALADHFLIRSGSSLWLINSISLIAMPLIADDSMSFHESELISLYENFEKKASLKISLKSFKSQIDLIRQFFNIEFSADDANGSRIFLNDPIIKLSIEGSLNSLDILASFSYPNFSYPNLASENKFLDNLSLDKKFQGEHLSNIDGNETLIRDYKCKINGHVDIIKFYTSQLKNLLKDKSIAVELGERFTLITNDLEVIQPRAVLNKSGSDWFEFDIEFTSPRGSSLNEREVRELINRGVSTIKKKDGINTFIDLFAASDLFSSLGLTSTQQKVSGDTVIRRVKGVEAIFIKENLSKFGLTFSKTNNHIDESLFKRFNGELKGYQKVGLSWMRERVNMQSGFILADEMGLGKTVQILSLISAIDFKNIPILIICPTSLLHNWSKEIKKFLPTMKFTFHYGQKRADLSQNINANEIVVTSYGTLISDVKNISEINFSMVVADEASFFKNPLTKTAKAIEYIRSDLKIAVTGTPIENNLEDLWSLMNIVNPNYLGSRSDFLSSYGNWESDNSKLSDLKKRVTPFILRRTKSEVLRELPDKVEKIIYCQLNEVERGVYNDLLISGKDIINSLKESNQSQDSMEVLTLLLRLRQSCCDINLFTDKAGTNFVSSKLELLEPILLNAINQGSKIIVFSQFVKMLNIIERHLNSIGISSFLLHGGISSEKRNELIDEFQDPQNSVPVFLVSLKAGGYGLNLTAADTVVHFDPWWNPSVENQATDRVHRIGQNKVVNCYKLIASNTVEEKILLLQKDKMNLIDMSIDEARPVMSGLTQDDLSFVLK